MIELVAEIAARHSRREIDRAQAHAAVARVCDLIIEGVPHDWMRRPAAGLLRVLLAELEVLPVRMWPAHWGAVGRDLHAVGRRSV